MKTIEIKGKVALVDDDDYGKLAHLKTWSVNKAGYAQLTTWDGKKFHTVYMHRMIMGFPKGKLVDHTDGNKLNNQRGNLRACTGAQNNQNQVSKARKLKGVFRYSYVSAGRPFARIRSGKKAYHLGTFQDEHTAALMYDFWAIELHKEFANTNFKVVATG